jgi:ribose transport system substrate-binding protein
MKKPETVRLGRRDVLAGAAAFAGAGLLAACGGESSSSTAVAEPTGTAGGRKRRVVWALAAIAPWNLQIDVGFIDATKQLGWDYQKVGLPVSQYSPENVVRVINQAIVTKPDVLVTPAWVPGVAAAAAAAQKQGILVMFNNANNIPDRARDLGIAFVGADERAGGRSLGMPFAAALAAKGRRSGKVVAAVGVAGNQNLNLRVTGAQDAIKAYNAAHGTSFAVELFVDDSGNGTENAINAYKAKILKEGVDLVGFLLAGGEQSVAGLLPALKSIGKQPGDYVVGAWDESEQTDAAVKDGWIMAIVDKQDYVTGYLPVFLAWAQLERGFDPRDYDTGGVLIDRSNVDRSLKRQQRIAALATQYGVKLA